MMGETNPEGQAPPNKSPDDAIKELVWILRRAMYVFIVWAERRYGWRQRPPEDEQR
jgi:hypothetical protein